MRGKSKIEERVFLVEAYIRRHGRAPTLDELCKLFGFSSKSSAVFLARKLVDMGVLNRTPTGRLFAPSKPSTARALRLLGSVTAGFPTPAEETLLDTLSLDEYLVARPEATFMLRVEGDSMVEAGILPGDTVLVERGRAPLNGDIVIACVDGEWTMKFFFKEGRDVRLEPANRQYATIRPRRSLAIEGVVGSVIRKLL